MSGVKGVMMDMYKDIVSVEANKVRADTDQVTTKNILSDTLQ